jgi:hypothetical protein
MVQSLIRSTALAAVALTLVIGCGGPGGSKGSNVSGKVTIAGKGPLPGGNITFTPVSAPDKARTGAIKGDGSYIVVDVTRGECKVSVENASLRSIPQSKGTDMPGMGMGDPVKYVPIDAKFAKPETSGLSTNVDRSEVTYDVELK